MSSLLIQIFLMGQQRLNVFLTMIFIAFFKHVKKYSAVVKKTCINIIAIQDFVMKISSIKYATRIPIVAGKIGNQI